MVRLVCLIFAIVFSSGCVASAPIPTPTPQPQVQVSRANVQQVQPTSTPTPTPTPTPVPPPIPVPVHGVKVTVQPYGKDETDGSGVAWLSAYPNPSLSDDPKRESLPNAQWHGEHWWDGSKLCLAIRGLEAPYPPANRLSIGYVVALQGTTFEDGSSSKTLKLYEFSRTPEKREVVRCESVNVIPVPPTPTPVPTATPIPATPAAPQTPTPGPVGKNEIVLFDGEVSRDEEIMPGAGPKQFLVRLGGCNCMRSLAVETVKLNPNQDQGTLQKEIRLNSIRGEVKSEGQEFLVPYNGIFVYIFIWANPGTKLGDFERVTARMKEGGEVVDSVTLAEGLKIPESLPIHSLVYQPFGDGVTGSVWIKNKSPRSQTINTLKVSSCSFPTRGSPRFSREGDIVILPGETLGLNINITVPAGTQLEGVVFCVFTFERKQEDLTLEQLIN